MKRIYPLLIAAVSCALMYGCASSGVEKVPKDWQYEAAPVFDEFDSASIVNDAKKLLGYHSDVEVMTMNSELSDEDIIGLTGQLLEARKQGKPVVCISRHMGLIGNAIERALKRFPNAQFIGMRLVVAAPNAPSKIFEDALAERNIEYHYMKVAPAGPYGRERSK
ncbi:MAG TPA: hypothetical protein VN873_18510 [Candidatus Angelobacter sp.]|nr:hypothetical protein [Candidatus Angelobacter sp.]